MRRKARVDINQSAIADFLKAIGASVLYMHSLGMGAPDMLVGFREKNYLLEIKSPDRKRRENPDQTVFHLEWAGQVDIVETIDDVRRILKV